MPAGWRYQNPRSAAFTGSAEQSTPTCADGVTNVTSKHDQRVDRPRRSRSPTTALRSGVTATRPPGLSTPTGACDPQINLAERPHPADRRQATPLPSVSASRTASPNAGRSINLTGAGSLDYTGAPRPPQIGRVRFRVCTASGPADSSSPPITSTSSRPINSSGIREGSPPRGPHSWRVSLLCAALAGAAPQQAMDAVGAQVAGTACCWR